MSSARDLAYNGSTSVLVSFDDEQPALWVVDHWATGDALSPDSPQRFTIDDINESVPLAPDQDLEPIIAEWKHNVDWTGSDRDWLRGGQDLANL